MTWPGGTDLLYRAALAAPHEYVAQVDVTDAAGNVLLSDIPVVSGQVSATLQSRVARTVDLVTVRDLFPVTALGDLDPSAPLAPYGNRLRITAGIRYGSGLSAMFPVFYGRIEEVKLNRAGQVTVNANDLAADVADEIFLHPTNSVPGNSISQEWRRLIEEAVPDAQFGLIDTSGGVAIGQLSWESDRAQALDDMCASVGALWYPLADGSFTMRREPSTVYGRTPDLVVSDGAGPGVRLLTDWEIGLSRTGVYNAVVFTSERLDGSPPFFGEVFDTDTSSPTYWSGNFGHKPRIIQNQSATSDGQCVSAARIALQIASALTQTWDNVVMPADASLELGDLLSIRADGVRSLQVVSSFTLPLRESTTMRVSLEAYAPLAGN